MIRFVLLLLVMSSSLNESTSTEPRILSNLKSMIGWTQEISNEIGKAPKEKLETKVTEVLEQINKVGVNANRKLIDVKQSLIRRLSVAEGVDQAIEQILKHIRRIDDLFFEFRYYLENPEEIFLELKEDFARKILIPTKNGAEDNLIFIYDRFISGEINETLLDPIAKATKKNTEESCDNGGTPQQRLYQIYLALLITELRGYVLMCYGYSILSGVNDEFIESTIDQSEKNIQNRLKNYMKSVSEASAGAPRDTRACDPPKYEYDISYVDFGGLFTTFIANENRLNPENSCAKECGTLPNPTRTYDEESGEWAPRKHQCPGNIYDCYYGGDKITYCSLAYNEHIHYEWFKTANGTMHGEETKCEKGKIKNEYSEEEGKDTCDHCICTCVANGKQSRAVYMYSLRQQIALISKNMVVTGIRFISKYGLIHLQIEHGQLGPGASIVEGTNRWMPIEAFYTDRDSGGPEKKDASVYLMPDGYSRPDTEVLLEKGRGYSTITMEDNIFFLDDIHVPEDRVVAGAGLELISDHGNNITGKAIILTLMTIGFDFKTGTLDSNKEWITYKNMQKNHSPEYEKERQELILDEPDSPIKTRRNLPDSTPNSFVRFRNSDRKKDAGRLTVPFFDSMRLNGDVRFPLQGVGIFHKGATGSGGFISPRIWGMDISKHFDLTE